ncbi:HD-GYP domain-containing protein [Caldimonas brevitalea]|uniref:HD-GYP domain-containing protein n=1 Tax=Caldimonas brevitalea TaxID=413882 RepID=A0A0G3C086_9BURK|nr:HD domain-containing phosphohydrolase [Caldimonas brevitalea]AKJ32195.1 hypothetical protein AAW51_5504 [Caldimonas brevitalea]
MTAPADVNRHYLDRVMDAAKSQEIEATEDIVAGNGMKLLSKGARIDERVRERLLEYKLRKPLESSLRVAGGVSSEQLAEAGLRLLEQHATLKAVRLPAATKSALGCLSAFPSIDTLQTLLTLYCGQDPHKLDHAVAVSLLAISLHQRLQHDHETQLQAAMLSGLFHDVGELYIDPAVLQSGGALSLAEWKQVCVHPLVAHRLISDIPQLHKSVAEAVLQHHERLDGFGYPAGLKGDAIGRPGRILGASELLAGIAEGSRTPLNSACVALKLVPDEFDRALIDAVASNRAALAAELEAPVLPPWDDTLAQVEHLVAGMQRVDQLRPLLAARLATIDPATRHTFSGAAFRYERICMALISAGVNTRNPDELQRLRQGEVSPAIQLELTLVLREIRWRLQELGRELTLRVQRTSAQHADLAVEVVAIFNAGT